MKKLIIKHAGFNRAAIVISALFGLYAMLGDYPNFGYTFFGDILKFVMSSYFPNFSGFPSPFGIWLVNTLLLVATIICSLISYLFFKTIEWAANAYKNNNAVSKLPSSGKWFLVVVIFLIIWNLLINLWRTGSAFL